MPMNDNNNDHHNNVSPKHHHVVDRLLVADMQAGEDGIRRLSTAPSLLKAHRDRFFRTCGHEKGQDRRPPNKHDLEIVTTSTVDETKLLESGKSFARIGTYSGEGNLLNDDTTIHHNPIIKSPLPYVYGSFLLENVLSPLECDRLIAMAETAGYHPDEPLAGQPGASILAHACVWIVDHALERTIFDRVRPFLPTFEQAKPTKRSDANDVEMETLQPLGINRRFRFYRYIPGRYYRPHIDGAWPPSGFDKFGNYRYDICDEENKNGLQFVEPAKGATKGAENAGGMDDDEADHHEEGTSEHATLNGSNDRRQMSRLTFLIYLNDDFEGGATTFLIPAKEKEGTLNAFPVRPVRGGIFVFPHGTCAAALHEGSPVLKRCKYVVRTEVEYFI